MKVFHCSLSNTAPAPFLFTGTVYVHCFLCVYVHTHTLQHTPQSFISNHSPTYAALRNPSNCALPLEADQLLSLFLFPSFLFFFCTDQFHLSRQLWGSSTVIKQARTQSLDQRKWVKWFMSWHWIGQQGPDTKTRTPACFSAACPEVRLTNRSALWGDEREKLAREWAKFIMCHHLLTPPCVLYSPISPVPSLSPFLPCMPASPSVSHYPSLPVSPPSVSSSLLHLPLLHCFY